MERLTVYVVWYCAYGQTPLHRFEVCESSELAEQSLANLKSDWKAKAPDDYSELDFRVVETQFANPESNPEKMAARWVKFVNGLQTQLELCGTPQNASAQF